MTPLELTSAIVAAQGYLVVASLVPREIGEVQDGFGFKDTLARVEQPVRVVSVSSREEAVEQARLAERLGAIMAEPPYEYEYFYRVESD